MKLSWRTRQLRGREIEIRSFSSALAAQTWTEVTQADATTGCTCSSLAHALTPAARERVSTAMDRAITDGHTDLAEHYRTRLAPCPTNRPTRTETETQR